MTTFTREDVNELLTDWFPTDVDPVYEGFYEVEVKTWPWPFMCEWLEGAWFVDKGVKIKQWRGLKEPTEEFIKKEKKNVIRSKGSKSK